MTEQTSVIYKTTFADHVELSCRISRVSGYDFHWHDDDFELGIVLNGNADLMCGKQIYHLETDDVFLIDPFTGHASFAEAPDTFTLIIHFSRTAFRDYVEKGQYPCFSLVSDRDTRNRTEFRQLRFLAAVMTRHLAFPSVVSKRVLSGSFSLLTALLFSRFSPEIKEKLQKNDIDDSAMKRVIEELSVCYPEKISLETFAQKYGYNRTYFSSVFKKIIGIGFYDYLTLIRFQNAVRELAATDKTLTAISEDNGFAEPKLFNRMFREHFGFLPAEYRKMIQETGGRQEQAGPGQDLSPELPLVRRKLAEYTDLP